MVASLGFAMLYWRSLMSSVRGWNLPDEKRFWVIPGRPEAGIELEEGKNEGKKQKEREGVRIRANGLKRMSKRKWGVDGESAKEWDRR